MSDRVRSVMAPVVDAVMGTVGTIAGNVADAAGATVRSVMSFFAGLFGR